jgi:hypothetical protein
MKTKILTALFLMIGMTAMAQTRASDSTPKAPQGATYTLSDGSTVTKTGETLTNTTQYNNVVQVSKGTLTLDNCTISKTGDGASGDNSSFYGTNSAIYAGDGTGSSSTSSASSATININGGSITTSSQGANAIFATNGATINVSGVTIDNSQTVSRGMHATFGGIINASDMNITTRKATSSTVATDRGGGTVTVTGSTLTAKGDKSAVLYSTGVIMANNVTGLSEQGPIATVEGTNYAYINDSQMTSGSSKRGILLHQSGSGDAQGKKPVCEVTRSTLTVTNAATPLCYVVNSTATLKLTDVTLDVPSKLLMTVPTDSKGSGSTGTLVLNTTKDGWTYTGTVSSSSDNSVAVEVGSNIIWQLTANTYVNSLTNNGTIVTNGYTLTYGSLSGNGTINETTGIETVKSQTNTSTQIYNLAGQRVNDSTKGINIKNGKKVVIK